MVNIERFILPCERFLRIYQWILVHIEVQGYADKEFPERMFRYFYRIFDKYNEKIVTFSASFN